MNIIHEHRAQCANDILRQPFTIAGLMKSLGCLLIIAALGSTVQAASVTVAWNKSTNSMVAGYNVHYGGTSGTYTNTVNAASATNTTISGLVQETTYYFAATTYLSSGLESAYSSEISYTVPSTSVATTATLWPGTAVPAVVDGGPDSAVELGVKFNSDTAGSITGIRFYKASANTGTHVGSLWTSTGTLLATATFAGEIASGWQQVNFATPVSISANTVYVASYHANIGHYSFDNNYFSTNGVNNPPLHAPATGVSGGNGIYIYSSSSAFPHQVSSNARNYWVDVVWQAGLPVVPEVQLRVTPTRQFILTVNGPVGHTYNIQATQDFITWTIIGTVTVGTNGTLNFTDTNAASFSRRFYRTQ